MKRKILYITGEEESVTDIIKRSLEGVDYEFVDVHTRKDAETEMNWGDYVGVFLETLRVGPKKGYEHCRDGLDLVEDASEKGLPVLVLSGAGSDVLDRARELGATRVLNKPCAFLELPGVLKEVFG